MNEAETIIWRAYWILKENKENEPLSKEAFEFIEEVEKSFPKLADPAKKPEPKK